MLRIARWWVAACGLSLALGGPAAAQSAPQSPQSVTPVLAVPFLAQSELLCGGAALAMVERYFGAAGVYAEDFAGLVRPADHGIRTTDLAAAAGARGWHTHAFDGSADQVRALLQQNIPVIVLIAVARDRYHYVVILGWTGGYVIYHDPAVGPGRSREEASFLRAWDGGQRWAMTIGPGPKAAVPVSPGASSAPAEALPCPPLLERALDAADADSLTQAAAWLDQARMACPEVARTLREQAGVEFRLGNFSAADSLATAYLARVADDTLGWQILAASQFRAGNSLPALDAWNAIGRPRVELVSITGVHRIRYPVLERTIGIPHRTILSREKLILARRRLQDVPALRGSGVSYHPLPGGRVQVDAAVSEQALLPPWWALGAVNGITALGQRQVAIGLASPLGLGERWAGSWRWAHAHPLADVTVDLPVRLGVTGVIGFDAGWERWRYATTSPLTETRRAGSVSFGGWIGSALRPSVGVRLEHWSDDREYLVPGASVEWRAARDRLSVRGRIEEGAATSAVPSYTTGSIRMDWASSFGLRRATWSARLGIDAATGTAPLGVQPVASGDIPLAIPLRAHPWSRHGLIPANTIGQTILHGGVSGDQPIVRRGLFTVAAGIFMDGAQVTHPADGSNRQRWLLDAGAGLRIGILDGEFGVIRVDVATGLTDHTTALTVGLHQEWPTFRGRAR